MEQIASYLATKTLQKLTRFGSDKIFIGSNNRRDFNADDIMSGSETI